MQKKARREDHAGLSYRARGEGGAFPGYRDAYFFTVTVFFFVLVFQFALPR